MKTSQVLTIIPIVLVCLLLAPCTLDQYQHQKIISIKAKFPAKIHPDSNNKLNRPDGTDQSYVPSFVDKITMRFYGQTSVGKTIDKTIIERRDDTDGFTNQLDMGDVDYGDDFSIEVNAYTCNSTDLDQCDENEDWILTHDGSLQNLEIFGAFESQEVSVMLSLKHGTDLDTANPHSFKLVRTYDHDPALSVLVERAYCMDVDQTGNVGFSWIDPKAEFEPAGSIKASVYDSHAILQSEQELSINVPVQKKQSCKFYNGNFLMPFGRRADKNDLVLGYLDKNLEYSEVLPEIDQRYRDNNKILMPQIDTSDSFIFIAWIHERYLEGNGDQVSTLLNPDFSQHKYLNVDIKGRIGLSIRTVDDTHFAVLSQSYSSEPTLQNQLLSYIIDSNGSATVPEVIAIQDNTTLPNFFSITKVQDGNYENLTGTPFLITYNSGSMKIQTGFFDKNLTGSSVFSPLSDERTLNYNQANPFIATYGSNTPVLVWADTIENSNYRIYYSILDSSAMADLPKKVFEPKSGLIYSGSPAVSVNEDGLAVISWVNADTGLDEHTLNFKRYLF